MAIFLKGDAMLESTSIDNIFILEYLPKAEADFVKVYLFGLMQCNHAEAASYSMEELLHMDSARIAQAFQYWQSMGLVRIVSDSPLTVMFLRPWQSSAMPDSDTPRRYASLVAALTDAGGTRVFTGRELGEIYDWIETFRFDEATAVLCVKQAMERHGARAKLWQMNALAKLWADNGVLSVADAEALIAQLAQQSAGAQAILKRWKRTRAATEDELALYHKWTEEWGIEENVILSACAEATSAAQPSFKYLDTILDTYRMQGALTAERAAEMRKQRDASVEFVRILFERANLKKAPTLAQREQIEAWLDRWHMSAELVLLAADAAREDTQPFSAIKRLVTAWHDAGISALRDAQAYLEQRRSELEAPGRKQGVSARYAAYPQRKYTEEELENIGIKLLDD